MFDVHTIRLGMRAIVEHSVLEELENGARLPADCNTAADVVAKVFRDPDALCELTANVAYLMGRLAGMWHEDPWLVFYHMGWTNAWQQADALDHLLFGLFGHGVGLDDYCHDKGLAGLSLAEATLNKPFPTQNLFCADQNEMIGNVITPFLVCDK
jgi:hypothetical protein